VQKPFYWGYNRIVTMKEIQGFHQEDRVERGRVKDEKRGLKH